MCFRQCENVTNVSALARLFLVLLLVSVSIQRIPLEAVPGERGLATREGAEGAGRVQVQSVFVTWQRDVRCRVLLPVCHLVYKNPAQSEFPLLGIVLAAWLPACVSHFLLSFGVPGFQLESSYWVCFSV